MQNGVEAGMGCQVRNESVKEGGKKRKDWKESVNDRERERERERERQNGEARPTLPREEVEGEEEEEES